MLEIGLSCVDITPPVGIRMRGFAAREPSVRVHDELKAESLVLSDGRTIAALVSCDLCSVDAALVKMIREEASMRTGIPKSQISIACTHNHYGPEASENESAADVMAYRTILKFHLAGAIQQAYANMDKAVMGIGWGESHIGINRREKLPDGSVILGQNPEREIDREVGVIRFEDPNGSPAACIVNFACHAVCQGPRTRLISSDYPGKMREVVENLTGTTCMFLQGACGNINPISMEHSYEPARRSGTQLGCEVVKVWEEIETGPVRSLAVTSTTIQIPRYNYGCRDKAQARATTLEKRLEKLRGESATEGLIKWAEIRHRRALEALESWKTCGPMPKIPAEIMVWGIGDLGIAFVPAEVFNEIGSYIKKHSQFSNTFFVGYANGQIGYVPIREAYDEGGYEVDDACQVGPEAEELIMETCSELLEKAYTETQV